MALTQQEQALLDSLTAKASEPVAGPEYDSVEKILYYLVRTSSKFTANPEAQQEMLDYLHSVINPSADAGSPVAENGV